MTEVIRRFCEDEFAYDPRNTADGKVHLRKVTSEEFVIYDLGIGIWEKLK